MIKANLPRLCVLAVLAVAGRAQLAPPAREIPLYPGPAPGSENWNYPEKSAGTPDKPQAQNIARPVLLYYPADKATAVGTATIVAPGAKPASHAGEFLRTSTTLPSSFNIRPMS